MQAPTSRPIPTSDVTSAEIDELAHLSLQVGRLQLLTLVADDHFRTKIGPRLPGMNVGMIALDAVGRLLDDAENSRLKLTDARVKLDTIEHQPSGYSYWLIIVLLGLTAGSLSRLFGGDWPTFAMTWLAGTAGTWLRLHLNTRHFNPVAIPFASACLGGLVGGIAVLLGASTTPALCMVAPGMILVPGVPLINGVQDMIRNHLTLGLSRLGFAALVTTAIALGLYVATLLTGVTIPVAEPTLFVPVPEDAIFSALAAVGYVFLFSVPARMAWACVICGIASHTLRTICVHAGIDIITGTLIGALVASFLAQGFARHFHGPTAAFAFPGVVAMVPSAYAFRTIIGALHIAHGTADPALLADTLSLAITVVLMVGGIAVGIAAPALLLAPRRRLL